MSTLRRIAGAAVLLICLIMLGLTVMIVGASASPARVYHQPDGWIAEAVNCDDWERLPNNVWRAEGSAKVSSYEGDVVLRRVDVTPAHARDLYFTLELMCPIDLGV